MEVSRNGGTSKSSIFFGIFHEININKPSSELLGYPQLLGYPPPMNIIPRGSSPQPSPGRSSRHWDVHPSDSVARSPCPDSPTHRDAPATSGVEEKLRRTSGPGQRLGEEVALEVILGFLWGKMIWRWRMTWEIMGKWWNMMENAAGQFSQHVFKSQWT